MQKGIKVSLSTIKYGLLFILLLFITTSYNSFSIPVLQSAYQHLDEFLVIVMLGYIFINYKVVLRSKKKLTYRWLWFMSIGLLSSIIFRHQRLVPAAIDAVLVISKFIIGYLSTYIYCLRHKNNISKSLIGIARIISLILFVMAVHDTFMSPFFPRGDYRLFGYSLRLMFPHPTYLGAAAFTLLVLLGYTVNKKNIPYMIMISFVAIMTLRGKVIGSIVAYWAFFFTFVVFKKRRVWFIGITTAIAVFIIGYDQISVYFLETGYSPRLIMLRDSLSLAARHFPLGTGFGTFGSTIAADYYSPLYTLLGYESNYGMGSVGSRYLTDSFWPCIIAQFGYIGLLAFIIVIAYFAQLCIAKLNSDRIAGFSMLAIIVYMLITSIAETAFFNPTSLLIFMLLAIFETDKTNRSSDVIKNNQESV